MKLCGESHVWASEKAVWWAGSEGVVRGGVGGGEGKSVLCLPWLGLRRSPSWAFGCVRLRVSADLGDGSDPD